MEHNISILYPPIMNVKYNILSETTCHDLGLDYICKKLTSKDLEQKLLMQVLSKMTDDPEVSRYREEVFADILRFPNMRARLLELLDHIRFLRDYSSLKSNYDKSIGIWDLLHRMDEINDYITCVEGIRDCLASEDVQSTGLLLLRDYIDKIYNETAFAEMKKDIASLKADTSNLKSVTVGINVNERFEAKSIGIVSVNNTAFKSSSIVSNFAEALLSRDELTDGNHWNGEMRYHPIVHSMLPVDIANRLDGYSALLHTPLSESKDSSTLVDVPGQDSNSEVTHFMDRVVNQMLNLTVRKLRSVLSKYVTVTITGITSLIPEFIYYIRFAEFIEKVSGSNLHFSEATVLTDSCDLMKAVGIYNLKLAFAAQEEPMEIVTNDLDFDKEHMIYILTGANRGGKTTITQAIGLLYVLAQGGIYIPGDSFAFVPVDCIYTHFPADEDKTMDLGRLGEECTRFKEMYSSCTANSLLLLNETFSTTSFEEGYFIARDSIRAIRQKGARTIYNTHMHKLAVDIDEINHSSDGAAVASLIVKAEEGNRSFKVIIAPPVGMSYANDIAIKYGVTYEMLTQGN